MGTEPVLVDALSFTYKLSERPILLDHVVYPVYEFRSLSTEYPVYRVPCLPSTLSTSSVPVYPVSTSSVPTLT